MASAGKIGAMKIQNARRRLNNSAFGLGHPVLTFNANNCEQYQNGGNGSDSKHAAPSRRMKRDLVLIGK